MTDSGSGAASPENSGGTVLDGLTAVQTVAAHKHVFTFRTRQETGAGAY